MEIDEESLYDEDKENDPCDDESVLTDEATVKGKQLEIDEESLYDEDEENDPCDEEGVLTDKATVDENCWR